MPLRTYSSSPTRRCQNLGDAAWLAFGVMLLRAVSLKVPPPAVHRRSLGRQSAVLTLVMTQWSPANRAPP